MKSIGLVLAALMIASGARAADYPTKPINIIVPFAAGGSNDIVARAIGKGLADAWGQPVLIDNRAGAGGVIGAEAVARGLEARTGWTGMTDPAGRRLNLMIQRR
jgi:tripartite-type tricarboxylate transporter receptor subunit TctC